MPKVGESHTKHPDAVLTYWVDWTAYLDGGTISDSAWVIEGDDAVLTKANPNVSGGETSITLSAGTRGKRYKVINTITLSGAPTNIDPRHFYVDVRK